MTGTHGYGWAIKRKHRRVVPKMVDDDPDSMAWCRGPAPFCGNEACPKHNAPVYPLVAKHRTDRR